MQHLRIVELVRPTVCAETVAMLTAVRDAAARGEVIGAAVILLHPGRDYTVDIAGAARQEPTFCRGMLAKLDDELAKLPERTR